MRLEIPTEVGAIDAGTVWLHGTGNIIASGIAGDESRGNTLYGMVRNPRLAR